MISPELIVSKFLCDQMQDNESIIIIGSKRFSNYEGYGWNRNYFKWKNSFNVSELEVPKSEQAKICSPS